MDITQTHHTEIEYMSVELPMAVSLPGGYAECWNCGWDTTDEMLQDDLNWWENGEVVTVHVYVCGHCGSVFGVRG